MKFKTFSYKFQCKNQPRNKEKIFYSPRRTYMVNMLILPILTRERTVNNPYQNPFITLQLSFSAVTQKWGCSQEGFTWK